MGTQLVAVRVKVKEPQIMDGCTMQTNYQEGKREASSPLKMHTQAFRLIKSVLEQRLNPINQVVVIGERRVSPRIPRVKDEGGNIISFSANGPEASHDIFIHSEFKYPSIQPQLQLVINGDTRSCPTSGDLVSMSEQVLIVTTKLMIVLTMASEGNGM